MAGMLAGANAALTVENPHLTNVLVGLGWSVIPSRGPEAEPIALAVLCDASGKAISDDHLVFFNQVATQDGSVQFLGAEDQEQIDVDLRLVPENVSKIAFIVFIDPDLRGPGTFSSVRGAYIRVADPQNRSYCGLISPRARRTTSRR